MTEDEWLTATNPTAMFQQISNRPDERRFRFFCCACCRQMRALLTDQRSRQAVEIAEQMADHSAHEEVIRTARDDAFAARARAWDHYRATRGWIESWAAHAAWMSAEAALYLFDEYDPSYHGRPAPLGLGVVFVPNTLQRAAEDLSRVAGVKDAAAWRAAGEERAALQADLLRHILGNPFRPSPPLPQVPRLVRDLAEAVYRQDQAAVAPLHDALLENGLSELAEHFRDTTERHPKGCWAVDSLTGRT